MEIIICTNIFENIYSDCCFTDRFLEKYPQYNKYEYYLGVGNYSYPPVRTDIEFINAIKEFGIEETFKPEYCHSCRYKLEWNGKSMVEKLDSIGQEYYPPIIFVDIPDKSTDWTLMFDNYEGSYQDEFILYVLDGKIQYLFQEL